VTVPKIKTAMPGPFCLVACRVNHAMRIQARATRRCGELLEQFQTGPKGGRPKGNGGNAPTVSQREAADAAGLSKDQEVTARAVASVPADEFEAAVESDAPLCKISVSMETKDRTHIEADHIVSSNINRRHLTKGQRAMAVARIYPDAAVLKRKGSGSVKNTEHVSAEYVSHARTVLAWLPQVADAVLADAEWSTWSAREIARRCGVGLIAQAGKNRCTCFLGIHTFDRERRYLTKHGTEIRIRAERRLGELIAEQKRTVGLNQGAAKGKTGRRARPVLDQRPTLKEAGIEKDLSSRAQKLAKVPARAFEAYDDAA
jgi:hypothetical protein